MSSQQAPGVKDKGELEATPASQVNKFHNKSDVDSAQVAQHHTLGIGRDQAAAGNHIHDGKSSKQLFAGVTLTGAKGGNVALASVISALVAAGATDNTTA